MVTPRKFRNRRFGRNRPNVQQEFAFRTWGGKRKGAGRPKRLNE